MQWQDKDQITVARLNDQSDAVGFGALACYAAGGLLVVGAAALLTAHFVVGE